MASFLDRAFVPDLYFDTIYEITPALLKREGINALVLDIDNTLVTYDDPDPTPPVLRWAEEMRAAGISLAFVSNNSSRERVERFNRPFGFFATAKSGKPGTKYVKKAIAFMGASPETTCVVGDQVFTDIFVGKRMGTHSILVKPIKDKTTLFFRFKRKLEKPVLRRYARINGGKNGEN
ncbi:MAG: YqeG family HAD IIIA-type phosphatase [Lachnospiraceae bacterium]|nr:YqeG family HAD IIIA-type phosphatase [Lachnospiraceae bacterium]